MSKPIYRDDYSRYISDLEKRLSNLERASYTEATSPNPYVEVGRSTVQAISNSTNTPVEFDLNYISIGEEIHNISSNNTRFYAPIAGKYIFESSIRWEGNSTGTRVLAFAINSAGVLDTDNILARDYRVGNGSTNGNITLCTYLEEGDYIELFVYQDASGAVPLNLLIDYPNLPRMTVALID